MTKPLIIAILLAALACATSPILNLTPKDLADSVYKSHSISNGDAGLEHFARRAAYALGRDFSYAPHHLNCVVTSLDFTAIGAGVRRPNALFPPRRFTIQTLPCVLIPRRQCAQMAVGNYTFKHTPYLLLVFPKPCVVRFKYLGCIHWCQDLWNFFGQGSCYLSMVPWGPHVEGPNGPYLGYVPSYNCP